MRRWKIERKINGEVFVQTKNLYSDRVQLPPAVHRFLLHLMVSHKRAHASISAHWTTPPSPSIDAEHKIFCLLFDFRWFFFVPLSMACLPVVFVHDFTFPLEYNRNLLSWSSGWQQTNAQRMDGNYRKTERGWMEKERSGRNGRARWGEWAVVASISTERSFCFEKQAAVRAAAEKTGQEKRTNRDSRR